ncbi:MAG: hypothetical protein ACC656_09235, partial [Candidatus Heimdallarchaeota archaeon]
MSIRNWKQYNEQTTPVQTDTSSDQEMNQRIEDLETVRAEVSEITNSTNQIAGMNDAEAIDTLIEQTITSYENNRDTFVTLALTYMKTIADKKNIELRLAKYAEEIPELQNQMRSRTDQLNAAITYLRKT